jgi:hypothetical protein
MQPDKVNILLKTTAANKFKAATIEDYIDKYEYLITNDKISPKFVLHSKSYIKDRSDSDYRGLSPLYSVKRNVDNLLAVYSARYNVYVNNGAAGYLVKKSAATDMSAAFDDRAKIVSEINDRTGITGDKRLYGISSVPLEWINTLATIKDLMPMEEWTANFLTIAGAFGIDKDLLPLKEGTTFTNKEVAEAKIWNDIAISYANDVCSDLTTMFNLTNEEIKVRTTNIGFLQSNRKLELESDKILIENLNALGGMGIDTTQTIQKLVDKYGKEN